VCFAVNQFAGIEHESCSLIPSLLVSKLYLALFDEIAFLTLFFLGFSLRNLSAVQFVPWRTSGTVLSILCGDPDKLRTTQTMPPQTRPSRSTSRQSSQPNIDPNLFGALSITDLRSLCLQHGIPSTGVWKTLERRLRGHTPSRGIENIHEPAAQPGLQTTTKQLPRGKISPTTRFGRYNN